MGEAVERWIGVERRRGEVDEDLERLVEVVVGGADQAPDGDAVEDGERQREAHPRRLQIPTGQIREQLVVGRDAALEEALVHLGETPVQGRIGAGGKQQLEPGVEARAEAALAQQTHGIEGRALVVGQLAERGLELGVATHEQVLDGGEDEVLLRREVVDLRPPGHLGPLHHLGGGGARPADLDQALDGRIEQSQPRGGTAIGVGPAGWPRPGSDSRHLVSVGLHKQTVKPACL